jgi:hypothetical protein
MIVKLLKLQRNSAIISYLDEDKVFQAYIIDSKDLKTSRVGDEFEVEDNILSAATPYGVDWSVVFPNGLNLSAGDFQNVMYRRGIISLEDLKKNPSIIGQAIQELLNMSVSKIYHTVKIAMEDYHDSI